MTVYYFDTSALFKFYGNEAGSLTVHRLVANNQTLVSPLTQIEYVNRLLKGYRQHQLRPSEVRKLVERLRRDINILPEKSTRPFTAVELPAGIFGRAENLLLSFSRTNLSAMDALHLAIAEKLQIHYPGLVLITADHGMQAVCTSIKLQYFDPTQPQ